MLVGVNFIFITYFFYDIIFDKNIFVLSIFVFGLYAWQNVHDNDFSIQVENAYFSLNSLLINITQCFQTHFLVVQKTSYFRCE